MLDPLVNSAVMFAVVAAAGLAIFIGGVTAILPPGSRGRWLSAMAFVQLGMAVLLILAARSTLSEPGNMAHYLGMLFAAPLVIGGLGAAAMRVAVWHFTRAARTAGG